MFYSARNSARQVQQRYEDAVVIDQQRGHFSVWGVFDGHNGSAVSRFLATNVVQELEQRLPGPLADESDAQNSPSAGQYLHAEAVKQAILAAFLSLSVKVLDHLQHNASVECSSGCGATATIAVQMGPLLTVANCGNTKCVLDVGYTAFECSSDHKLGHNEDEERRLDAIGACIARLKFDLSGPAAAGEEGCGPLRLWPGGLHMSRAIGDLDCGQPVIPHPYIQQVWLPQRASRMIIATGGVWESFETFQKAVDALRDVALPNAAAALLRRSLQHKQHNHYRGDLSVVVVDFVPECCTEFRSQVRLDRDSCASTCSSHSTSHPMAPVHSFLRKSPTAKHLVQRPDQNGAALMASTRQHQAQGDAECDAGWQSPVPSPGSRRYQQHQQHSNVLQRLLPLLCSGPPMVLDHVSGTQQQQQQQSGIQVLQQASSFGSSPSTKNRSKSNRHSLGWRSKRPAAAGMVVSRSCIGSSMARILSRCDTFQVYFNGAYQPLQQQLALLELQLQRTSRPHVLSAQRCSSADGSAEQQSGPAASGAPTADLGDISSTRTCFRRTSSDMSISSTGCFSHSPA